MSAPSFPEFFTAVHGYEPFPWQERLAELVVASGWPSLLDLPTGSGKTSVLDIALYALAVVPARAPRRVFLVVDRRIVVDQGALYAQNVLRRLREGAAPEVAARLRSLFESGGEDGDRDPFQVTVLRGGIPREDDWAKRPDQPVLGVSTVDQVGSRLLFRGYGVSERMSPVHAGLLGNDTLFLLDEVHLAQPFAQTLGAIANRWRTTQLDDRFAFVQMSATPDRVSSDAFKLDGADRRHPTLSRRLQAKKRARLVEVKVVGDEPSRRKRFADGCVKEALRFLDEGSKVVGVVVNRVDSAREVWRQLEDRRDAFDVVLLTGRMRPLDRDLVLEGNDGILARASAVMAREQRPCPRPLVIVATQCIEAGADLDLDALVTECASIDALRQRFGRLDRLGALGTTKGTVLIRSDQRSPTIEDPVYGSSFPATWNWLCSLGEEIDLGIDEMDRLLADAGDVRANLIPEVKQSPILLPAHLDSWVQTSPRPYPDPDVALWLHGFDPGAPDVNVIWRADIHDEDLLGASGGDEEALNRREDIVALLTACPPSALETLAVPIYAARAWLRAQEASAIDDATNRAGIEDSRHVTAEGKLALRWLGDRSMVVRAGDLLPGDTLIVPSRRGGLTAHSWDPSAAEVVADLGDLAQLKARGRPTLRMHPDVLRIWGIDERSRTHAPRSASDEVDADEAIADWLRFAVTDPVGERRGDWESLRDALLRGRRIVELPDQRYALVAKQPRHSETTTEADDGSFIERAVTLRKHCDDVRRWVRRFARALGLDDRIADDLALAAWLHDVGKADPRFQLWLVDGNPVRQALLHEPLAKSAGSSRDSRSRELARRRARYPVGYRHESLSAAMALSQLESLKSAYDRDLVAHLVASHHGWARPFAPVPVSPAEHLDVYLDHEGTKLHASTLHGLGGIDSGVSDRFWTLTERYGWWGLAWLEAILRLADHRASEEESG